MSRKTDPLTNMQNLLKEFIRQEFEDSLGYTDMLICGSRLNRWRKKRE